MEKLCLYALVTAVRAPKQARSAGLRRMAPPVTPVTATEWPLPPRLIVLGETDPGPEAFSFSASSSLALRSAWKGATESRAQEHESIALRL